MSISNLNIIALKAGTNPVVNNLTVDGVLNAGNIDIANLTVSGNITCEGNLTVKDNVSTGAISVEGDGNFNSDVTVNGSLIATHSPVSSSTINYSGAWNGTNIPISWTQVGSMVILNVGSSTSSSVTASLITGQLPSNVPYPYTGLTQIIQGTNNSTGVPLVSMITTDGFISIGLFSAGIGFTPIAFDSTGSAGIGVAQYIYLI